MKRCIVLATLVGALALGCKRPPTASSFQLSTEPPVAAPDTLIAEGTLRDPDAFWGRLKANAGPALASAPATAAGLILRWAGADPAIGAFANGAQPFYLAIGNGPEGTDFALAMRIGDFDAARQALTDGDAGFTLDPIGTLIHLIPRGGEHGVVVGVARSGYVVVASSVTALSTLGPYAARTLPTKAAPVSSIELRATALARAATDAPALTAKIARMLAATGRSYLPEEVDAAALVACFSPSMEQAIAAGADLSDAHIDIDDDGATVHATGSSVPKPGKNAAQARIEAMHPGSAAPLLDAPPRALASFFWSDTVDERLADVKALAPCVGRALSPILGKGGDATLEQLLSSWARGRGDWMTASVVEQGVVAGLVGRAPVAHQADVTAAFQSFVALSSERSLQDAIRGMLPSRAGGAEPPATASGGNTKVLMFAPHLLPSGFPDAAPEVSSFAPPGLAWTVSPSEVAFGLGFSPAELVVLAHRPARQGADPATAAAITALGANSVFALVVRPPGCCSAGQPASAPLTFGWGRKGPAGLVTLQLGDELVGLIAAHAG